MAKLIDLLPTPTVIPTDFGTVTLTHKAIGFRAVAWERPRVSSFSVLGVFDAQGQFKPYPGTEQTANWKPADVAAVFRDGTFTTDELITRHEAILVRP